MFHLVRIMDELDQMDQMDQMDELDELLICRLEGVRKPAEPCSLVIFGASGDLTARKLIPALYHLHTEGQLPDPFRVVGVARREKTDGSWREELKEALTKYSRSRRVDQSEWEKFAAKISYVRGDISNVQTYADLGKCLHAFEHPGLQNNHLFYLATLPSQFAEVVEHLHHANLINKNEAEGHWQRVVVEKPFGHDLASAHALNHNLTRFLHEKQIFRIDHYLGKETVQNILIFRFSNAIFEQLWSRQSIDHVQITVSEHIGVGSRGGYYEEAGALRDMVQNHLLQVLALAAMEPPVSLEAEAIRDEKVKLLKSIRPILPQQVEHQVVRGQYTEGQVDGLKRAGYRDENRVAKDSNVETFLALKLFIDNWRWSGVPFYLRTGKNLPVSASEVRIQFRRTPHVLFAAQCGPALESNALALRLQPDEGIYLRFNGKIPGSSMAIRQVRMHFSYNNEFGAYTPEAYERLLLEAIAGDATLFIRSDEVETAWRIADSIRAGWDGNPLSDRDFYPAGTWGPQGSDELLARHGHSWRNPEPLK